MAAVNLSITLATYNVEEYIEQSINSIINQTFKDFELICIDDGSTDNTTKILFEYAEKDSRIKLHIKEKNEGLASARNDSLKFATGKYVAFLDGDDIYDLTLFEKAIKKIEEDQSDIIYWDYLTFEKSNDLSNVKNISSSLLNSDFKIKKKLLKKPSFAWTKLIKTEIAREINIEFPLGLTRQDIPVHWKLVIKIDRVSYLSEKLAFYRQQPNATTQKKDQRLFDLVYVMDIVEDFLMENNLYKEYEYEFLTQRLNFFHSMYDNIDLKYKPKALQLIKERLNEDTYYFLNKTKLVRPQANYFLMSLNGSKVNKIKFLVWNFARLMYRKFK